MPGVQGRASAGGGRFKRSLAAKRRWKVRYMVCVDGVEEQTVESPTVAMMLAERPKDRQPGSVVSVVLVR